MTIVSSYDFDQETFPETVLEEKGSKSGVNY